VIAYLTLCIQSAAQTMGRQTDCRRTEVQVFPVLVKGVPEVFNRSVNQLRVLGRWVRMFTIPGQSLVPVSATAGSTYHYLQSGNFP
jgi:hypothetical protein